MSFDPVVFISSTSDDLKEHREQAANAARASGFSPRMMEYLPVRGDRPSLQACLEMAGQAEVVVVLVAHRYGWVPDDPTNPDAKSITWLECDCARRKPGREVLACLVDPECPWPDALRESYRLVTERNRAIDDYLRVVQEVKRNEKKLEQFRKELSQYFRGKFTDAASVRPLVSEALSGWRQRHLPTAAPGQYQDPDTCLRANWCGCGDSRSAGSR